MAADVSGVMFQRGLDVQFEEARKHHRDALAALVADTRPGMHCSPGQLFALN